MQEPMTMNQLKNNKNLSLATLVLAGGLTACADDGATAGVAVQALSTETSETSAPLEMVDDAGARFEVSAASLVLRHIELDLPDGHLCDEIEADLSDGVDCQLGQDTDTIKIDGPFRIDLVSGTSTPSLADMRIPAGTYERIDFRVEDDTNNESFAVTAAFNLDGEAHTLELSLDFNEDIRIERPEGISVGADEDLVAFYLSNTWLAGINIATCIEDGDVDVSGTTVSISDGSSSGSCSDIESIIKNNMKNSGQLDRR